MLYAFSWRRLRRLLQILTAQIDNIIATMKNNTPPTTPPVTFFSFIVAGNKCDRNVKII
jgi:hypothetical protein